MVCRAQSDHARPCERDHTTTPVNAAVRASHAASVIAAHVLPEAVVLGVERSVRSSHHDTSSQDAPRTVDS